MHFLILLFTVISSLVLPSYVCAQDDEFVPEGPRGRWSVEQAKAVALQTIYGEVIGTDIEREDDHVFYEYTIVQSDNSVFEVEVNASTGEVYEIEAEYLSANPRLPEGLIDKNLASVVAASHTGEKGKGRLKPKVKSTQIDIFERKLVYDVLVKKGVREYNVYVDAFSSDVVGFEELD